MKIWRSITVVVSCMSWIVTVWGQSFSGIDELGRILPQTNEVGPPKQDKHVGIFYFLWQGDPTSKTSEQFWDLNELYRTTPEVFPDFDHPGWGGGAGKPGRYYFWGESIYGYYRGDDYWVHLKNVQLMTDAGVDFLVIDATNRLTYPRQSEVLMHALDAVNKQGKAAPKLVYYTNTSSGDGMQEIYNQFYKEGAPSRYPECWFYLDGKPLIIGISKQADGRDYADFFTIRESQWPNEDQKINGWPWIEFQRPQKVYVNHRGEREIVNVSAAQHPNLDASMGGSAFYGKSGNWGRSFRNGSPGDPQKDLLYGYNIQEQWDFALQQDVPFIFVTGWNEWIAGKWRRASGNPNEALFVDQASPEYSRDIEPAWTAGLRDNYYMQLVNNIRRYKGISPSYELTERKSIVQWSDWNAVPVLYQDYTGDIIHREHPGAQSDPVVVYKNTTGRNDLDKIKIAASKDTLYFYISTVSELSPVMTDNWMTLWLNTDESYRSGWNGYDLRVVKANQLQRYRNGYWENFAKVKSEVSDNRLMVAVPFSYLGMPPKDAKLKFKWSDNMQKEDPLDWYINGDAAPGGRFNLQVAL